jgi:gliding motility-associated-like protein/uncharacterized repeat protein (TIGR01451 family)
MKNNFLPIISALIIFFFSNTTFGQAPVLGTAADFVLFSSVGAVGNTGISQVTGNVGTNSGAIGGFGNVNGVMHTVDGASGTCATDLLNAYNQLNATIPTLFPGTLLGNGTILNPGVYSTPSATTLNLDLILDGLGDPNAVFIFQIHGTFSANTNSKIKLINGTKACNVFWQIEGLVSMASGTTMRGTVIANNAAINMSTGDTLEGRALSTAGAVNIDGVLAYTPIGCGSVVLTGPIAPTLASAACYSIFSSDGPVTNVGVSNVVGDIGTNLGTTTGYNPLLVVGTIHLVPDGSTAACAADLLNTYNYLNALPFDIELLYPAQFGNNLVLTPHTYLLNAAVTFTDTLYLNAEDDPNAVFVIQVKGAFATSVNSRVVLINGTQSRNVYWSIDGAVTIDVNSIFRGTIICNNGAINLNTNATLDGRALTTTGAVSTSAVNVVMPPGCGIPSTTITTQPSNQSTCTGGSVSFSVVAAGAGLTYQWRKGIVYLVNGGNISGVTTATLTINPATISDTSSFYNVVIGGSPNDTSNNVSLMINTAPVIITQPISQTVCSGSSVSFTVVATGSGLTYQWRNGIVNLINGVNISGATTATLTINPATISDTSSFYNVVITGACAPTATSVNVSLMINSLPIINTQPNNQTVCSGNSASFSVIAVGVGLSYQWRNGIVNLTNGANISGANTATLVINPATISDTSSFYNVVISGVCGPNATSLNASLLINTLPTITSQPNGQAVCAGSSVSFSVAAIGTALTYQWRKGIVNLINGGNISGVNTATLVINPATISDTSSFYNVVIGGTCSPNDTSLNVSLMINTAPIISSQPVNQTVCAGSLASFSVAASGTTLTYQWRKGIVNLVNGGNISGVTTATLTINPANISDTSSFYNVIVSGVCAPNVISANAALMINTLPTITSQPSNQTVCAGSSASFSIAASGTTLTYQWRKGIVNLVNGGNISGVTTATLTINPANISDTSSFYNVVIGGTCSPNATSVNASLLINTSPTITSQPNNQTVCPGSSVSFSVAATGAALTYQWRKGIVNLVNGGNISGVTTATLVINPANISDTSSFYNVVIGGACSPNATSLNASLLINTLPTITSQPNSQTVCAGSPASFSVTATGTALTYQWRKGIVNLVNGGNISGVTTPALTINPANISDTSSFYNVVISGACSPNSTSINASLMVNLIPTALASSNSPVCIAGVINLTAQTVTGATYLWVGPNTFSSSTQNPVINNATPVNGGTYSLTVTNNGCTSAESIITIAISNCNGSDLSVVKTVSNTRPFVGQTVVFTITASNSGPNAATGVEVTDVLQSGYTYVSSNTSTGSYDPSTGVWTIGTLNNGATCVLTITVTVNAIGNYVNTAIIYGNQLDPNMPNNNSSVETFPTDFNIPEGFSPNGDGINDLFVIRGIYNFPKNAFEIFNRWGDKVFEANPYQNTWDGKATKGIRVGGDELPVGTYFYVLDLGDGSPIYKGTICLNK